MRCERVWLVIRAGECDSKCHSSKLKRIKLHLQTTKTSNDRVCISTGLHGKSFARRAWLRDQAARAFCSISSARCACSPLSYAKRPDSLTPEVVCLVRLQGKMPFAAGSLTVQNATGVTCMLLQMQQLTALVATAAFERVNSEAQFLVLNQQISCVHHSRSQLAWPLRSHALSKPVFN